MITQIQCGLFLYSISIEFFGNNLEFCKLLLIIRLKSSPHFFSKDLKLLYKCQLIKQPPRRKFHNTHFEMRKLEQ